MPVFLKVKDGDRFRDVAVLVPGEPVTIGRTDVCDLNFPEDLQMSSRHASVELRDDTCVIKDLGSTNGTRLNEKPIETAEVSASDVIRCGGTEFAVEWSTEGPSIVGAEVPSAAGGELPESGPVHDHPAEPILRPKKTQPGGSEKHATFVEGAHAPAPAAVAVAEAEPEPGEHLNQIRGFTGETAAEIIERFKVPPDALPFMPDEGEPPEEFTQRLLNTQEPTASLTFLASALPKRCAVWWLIECVRQSECIKSDADGPMLAAAEKWVKEPSVETRRFAYQLAEELEMSTPASWAGVAAFWSDGSMAPPEAPPVPAPEHLTGVAVNGGVSIAALDDPENAWKRQQAFTELGLKIAAGESTWEDESA
ncbi:MAG: FHA domain-containing protein [Planctomycetaceae bacterium]